MDLLQTLTIFFYEKSAINKPAITTHTGTGLYFNSENKKLTDESHKPVITKFTNTRYILLLNTKCPVQI